MEPSQDPIAVRTARLNTEITRSENTILSRESLLDVLQVLYEECSIEALQKYDANIGEFAKKHKTAVKQLKQLRVNASDFEIKSVIGRGFFGEVHVVKEKQTGDVYAMKTIRKFQGADGKFSSFKIERDIMAFGASPWLTSLQYAFQDTTSLFFIMEYHPGGDLLGLLYRQGGTLPESAATFYVAELVLALEDLHKLGYVHRDIKPDNVLLDRCGHLKLADFGSAGKLDGNGKVCDGPPVGTPDYVAPEVLESLDNRNKNAGYGMGCDFWSLGVLAYELTIGATPFTAPNTTSVYSKIMNHQNHLKFSPDVVLSQAYVALIKGLITDARTRLTLEKIKKHAVFKNVNFETLRDKVPPFVPKISSGEDTRNFVDVAAKKKSPHIENYKKRTQFSGRNLPFVGFSYTQDLGFDLRERKPVIVKDEVMKGELEELRQELLHTKAQLEVQKPLEKKLEEKSRKLEMVEGVRDRLEKELAGSLGETSALKRTLELERKERSDLEKKALDLIKAAKLKWAQTERCKVEALTLELEQQNAQIQQLTQNNEMLNQQLQQALNIQGKQKESLAKVQSLSRRSVVGLESRLEELTNDTQTTISELRLKVVELETQNRGLEKHLGGLEVVKGDLEVKLRSSEENYRSLKGKIEEAEDVILKLSEKVTGLEVEVQQMESCKDQVESLKQLVSIKEKAMKDLQNRSKLTLIEQSNFEQIREENRVLHEQLRENVKNLTEIETKLLKETETTLRLKKQLLESESLQNEATELRDLRTKFWRLEKECNNAKIDKRILERELKDSETVLEETKKNLDELKTMFEESKKKQESALLELAGMNEGMSLEVLKAKEAQRLIEDKLKSCEENLSQEKAQVGKLEKMLGNSQENVKKLQGILYAAQEEVQGKDELVRRTQKQNLEAQQELNQIKQQKTHLEAQLSQAESQLSVTGLNLSALREACTLLENQLVEYEKICAGFEAKRQDLNANIEKLVGELCETRQEVQEAKRATNSEKSLRLLAETQIKRLKDDVQSLESESMSYKEQSLEYKDFSKSLSEDLRVAEEKIAELETVLRAYERQVQDMGVERNMLKEEATEKLTQVASVKEVNYKLAQQVKELKESEKVLIGRLHDLEVVLNEKSNFYKEREMKSESTIRQQIKLIDYLQTKIDEHSHKKKTLTDMLFGHSKKENTPPITLSKNYKDLEAELYKERQLNQQLQEQIFKLKTDSAPPRTKLNEISPKSKIAMEQLVKSETLTRSNSRRRMHHNIPHRFESKICSKITKCAQCSQQVVIGRSVSFCRECGVLVHGNCAKALPSSCGLPLELVNHYKSSLEKIQQETCELEEKFIEDKAVETWIKLPNGKNGWNKRYAVLSGTRLRLYMEPGGHPVDTIDLKPEDSHCKIIIEPTACEIDVTVAASDLPFVLKVEIAPNTTCWPARSLVFMALSVEDKENWFQALRKLFEEPNLQPEIEPICGIPQNLQVNCVFDLSDNLRVIGTESGLYSQQNSSLVYIEGPQVVHHIALLPSSNTVVMITEQNCVLVTCDYHHLTNVAQCAPCANPKLNYRLVNAGGLDGLHIVSVGPKLKLAVATSKQLVILGYDLDKKDFVPLRILDTAKPTRCMLFTEHSLIVGADKFFEIDLATFQAEEFIDHSDKELVKVEKCYKMGSFPLGVLELCAEPKEYLVCFTEFALFVDEFGSSTMKPDLIPTHLPLNFVYIKPYLYVVHFSSVELYKFGQGEARRIPLSKFRFVGWSKLGLYVCHEGQLKLINGKKLEDSLLETEDDPEEVEEFSFTSSMVQSLDGNLSEVDEGQSRHVRFSQTDL